MAAGLLGGNLADDDVDGQQVPDNHCSSCVLRSLLGDFARQEGHLHGDVAGDKLACSNAESAKSRGLGDERGQELDRRIRVEVGGPVKRESLDGVLRG